MHTFMDPQLHTKYNVYMCESSASREVLMYTCVDPHEVLMYTCVDPQLHRSINVYMCGSSAPQKY